MLLLVSVQTYLRVPLDESAHNVGWLATPHEAVPAVTVQTRFGSANLAMQSSLLQHCWQGPYGRSGRDGHPAPCHEPSLHTDCCFTGSQHGVEPAGQPQVPLLRQTASGAFGRAVRQSSSTQHWWQSAIETGRLSQ